MKQQEAVESWGVNRRQLPMGLGVPRVVGQFADYDDGVAQVGKPLPVVDYTFARAREELTSLSERDWLELVALFEDVAREVYFRLPFDTIDDGELHAITLLAGLCEELSFCAEARDLDSSALLEMWAPLQGAYRRTPVDVSSKIQTAYPSALRLVKRLASRVAARVADTRDWSSMSDVERRRFIRHLAKTIGPASTARLAAAVAAHLNHPSADSIRVWMQNEMTSELETFRSGH